VNERTKEPQGADTLAHGPGGAHLHDLRQGVDYLYCNECERHVACIPLEGDTWEVQCSRCVGECGLCSCRTAKRCLGKDGAPVDTHIHVARSARPERFHSPIKEVGDV
jgi:hypothetical protein